MGKTKKVEPTKKVSLLKSLGVLVGSLALIVLAGLAIHNISSLRVELNKANNKLNQKAHEINVKKIQLRDASKKLEEVQRQLDETEKSDSNNKTRIEQLENEKKDLENKLQAKKEHRERLARAAAVAEQAKAKEIAESNQSRTAKKSTTGDVRSLCKNWIRQAGVPESEVDLAYDLIMRESGCNPHAKNPSSGAYGIPQSLPASKLASAGAGWRDDPVVQIKWMKNYVQSRYGSWAKAITWHNIYHWY